METNKKYVEVFVKHTPDGTEFDTAYAPYAYGKAEPTIAGAVRPNQSMSASSDFPVQDMARVPLTEQVGKDSALQFVRYLANNSTAMSIFLEPNSNAGERPSVTTSQTPIAMGGPRHVHTGQSVVTPKRTADGRLVLPRGMTPAAYQSQPMASMNVYKPSRLGRLGEIVSDNKIRIAGTVLAALGVAAAALTTYESFTDDNKLPSAVKGMGLCTQVGAVKTDGVGYVHWEQRPNVWFPGTQNNLSNSYKVPLTNSMTPEICLAGGEALKTSVKDKQVTVTVNLAKTKFGGNFDNETFNYNIANFDATKLKPGDTKTREEIEDINTMVSREVSQEKVNELGQVAAVGLIEQQCGDYLDTVAVQELKRAITATAKQNGFTAKVNTEGKTPSIIKSYRASNRLNAQFYQQDGAVTDKTSAKPQAHVLGAGLYKDTMTAITGISGTCKKG